MTDFLRETRRRYRTGLLCGGALLLATALGAPATAAEWTFGNVEMRLNSTVSAGAGMRLVNPDADYIGVTNGGNDPNGVNFDDGNLNYRRGDFYSASTRLLNELEITAGNFGAFLRVNTFYDAINNDAESTRRTDLSKTARHRVGRGIDLLDAYVSGNFEIGNSPLTIRAGNQVINWGEALFTSGGISQTNALDVVKLVTPGTNIREAYLPSPMIYGNIGLFPNFNLEAYYQFQWRQSKLPPVGTFFATDDLFGPGAQGLFYLADPGGSGLDPATLFAFGLGIPKAEDKAPSDQGQFGVAARYFVENMSTELGLFFVRYHAKLPYFAGSAEAVPIVVFPFIDIVPANYFAAFPESIDLWGASVSFPVGQFSVAAEASYQPNFQVPTNENSLVEAALAVLGDPFLRPASVFTYPKADRFNMIANAAISMGPTDLFFGVATTAIGADSIDAIVEVGGVSFDKRPIDTTGDLFAWGYKLSASATYSNAFGSSVTLTPHVAFSHDVRGTPIDRTATGNFIEGRRAVTIGLDGTYNANLKVGVAYTNNMGGGVVSRNSDHDYATVAVSYAF